MTNRTASLAALVVMSGALAGSAPPATFQDLSAIPDNTWVRLNAAIPARSGGAEVYWAYDATNKVIVHYGGCTSPYTNEQWNFSLETRTWTMNRFWAPVASCTVTYSGGSCQRAWTRCCSELFASTRAPSR